MSKFNVEDIKYKNNNKFIYETINPYSYKINRKYECIINESLNFKEQLKSNKSNILLDLLHYNKLVGNLTNYRCSILYSREEYERLKYHCVKNKFINKYYNYLLQLEVSEYLKEDLTYIQKGFIKLLKKKTINKINIEELCKEAFKPSRLLNRMTLYGYDYNFI